jgi:hypothetical protein
MIEIEIPVKKLECKENPTREIFSIVKRKLGRKKLLFRDPPNHDDPEIMKNLLEHGTDQPQRNWTWATHDPDYLHESIDPYSDMYLVYDPDKLRLPKLEDWRKLEEPEQAGVGESDADVEQLHQYNLRAKEVHMFVNPERRKEALLAIVRITYGKPRRQP